MFDPISRHISKNPHVRFRGKKHFISKNRYHISKNAITIEKTGVSQFKMIGDAHEVFPGERN